MEKSKASADSAFKGIESIEGTLSDLGSRIRWLRLQAQLRLEFVAERTGIPASLLNRIENNEESPNLSIVYKLAETLNVSSEDLLGFANLTSLFQRMGEIEHKIPVEGRIYSYQDYKRWGGQWELIHGLPIQKAKPDMLHQRIVSKLCILLGSHLGVHLRSKGFEVFTTPFEVYLKHEKGEDSIVKPDITIVDGHSKMGCFGLRRAPELVIEVLSVDSEAVDRGVKMKLYQENQVQEYWIIDPIYNIVEIFTFLGMKDHIVERYSMEEVLSSEYLPNFQIRVRHLFE